MEWNERTHLKLFIFIRDLFLNENVFECSWSQSFHEESIPAACVYACCEKHTRYIERV